MNSSIINNSVKRLCVGVKKNSSTILMVAGIAGMIGAGVLAVRNTPKAIRLIEEEKKRQQVTKLPTIDIVKVAWHCYLPPVIAAVCSAACIVGSNSVNVRRNAALAAAYAISENNLNDYRKKVVETIGEKKEKEVREALDKEYLERNPIKEVVKTGKGSTRFFDPISARYFDSDIEFVRKSINNANQKLLNEGRVSLNDFYEELRLDPSELGDEFIWDVQNGLIEIEFGSQLDENQTPCVVIEYMNKPKPRLW